MTLHLRVTEPGQPEKWIAFLGPDEEPAYCYRDVDGDALAAFVASIPGVGPGVNIRTSAAGCSIPTADIEEFILHLREIAGLPKETG